MRAPARVVLAVGAWGVALAPALTGAAVAGPGSAPGSGRVEFTFADPAITESSGLVVDETTGRGLVVTTNDSGDVGRVFTVDPTTGATVGVTTWSEDPRDVEALAPAGPGEVWVGDIGDNEGQRSTISVARVPVGPGERTVDPVVHELVYPGGPQGGSRDAETLLAAPDGRLIVVSKGLLGGQFLGVDLPLGALSESDDGSEAAPRRLEVLGPALPFATDGAFLPDGRHLVVRGYGLAAFYAYPSLEEVATVELPEQEQGEGIAVDADGRILLSSEGVASDVLRLDLPRAVRRALAADPESPGDPRDSQDPGDPPEAGGQAGEPAGTPWLVSGALALGGLGLVALLGALVGLGVAALRARRTRG